MKKRGLFLSVLLLLPGGVGWSGGYQSTGLHRDALVMDSHVHMINRQFYLGGDIGDRYQDGQVDLPRLREGGVDAFWFSLTSSESYYPRRFEVKQTFRLMELALEQIAKNGNVIEVALTGADVERITRAGRMAAILDLEGGFDLDGDLLVLRALYRMGLRSAMLPAHNYTNNFADSCCDKPRWSGVNERGREVIREMNRLGMVINIAHGSNETILQTVAESKAPVLWSHGGFRHFVNTNRSLSDEAAKAIAAKGGVISIHFGNSFSNPAYYEWRMRHLGETQFGDVSKQLREIAKIETIEEIDKHLARRQPSKPLAGPPEIMMEMDQILKVFDYGIQLVGEDHLALGIDFDGGVEPPKGMKDVRDYPKITAAFQRHGYSEQRIRKIMGLNLLRLFKQVTKK